MKIKEKTANVEEVLDNILEEAYGDEATQIELQETATNCEPCLGHSDTTEEIDVQKSTLENAGIQNDNSESADAQSEVAEITASTNLQLVVIDNVSEPAITDVIKKHRSLKVISKEINKKKGQAEKCFIDIGCLLIESQEHFKKNGEVKRTDMTKWVKQEFDISYRTAYRFMRLAKEFSASPALANLGLTKTKADILLRLSDEEREGFIENERIEELSTRDLEKLVRVHNDTKLDCSKQENQKSVSIKNNKMTKVSPADLHGSVEFIEMTIKNLLEACMGNEDESKGNDVCDVYIKLRQLYEDTIERISQEV